jgi:hypothetical protein
MCGEQILVAARKCKHCGEYFDVPNGVKAQSVSQNEVAGTVLIALPCLGALLNLFWVGNMRLIDGPMAMLQFIAVIVVVGTAILASIEAARLGFGKDPTRPKIERTSPMLWFFGFLLLWIWEYPRYLYVRSRFGMKNLCAVGVLVALLFIVSVGVIGTAISESQSELRSQLDGLSRGLEEATSQMSKTLSKESTPPESKAEKESAVKADNESGDSKLFRETLAKAKAGDATSQSSLGVMYANGSGISKDLKEAQKWLLKAAEQGNARAQRNLYVIYTNGEEIAVNKNEAIKWLLKAVDQNEPQALCFLGKEFITGDPLPEDGVRAASLFHLALDHGYKDDDGEVRTLLSKLENAMTSRQKSEVSKLTSALESSTEKTGQLLPPNADIKTKSDIATPSASIPAPKEESRAPHSLNESFKLGDFSYAITSARKTGFIGSSDLENALVDGMVDGILKGMNKEERALAQGRLKAFGIQGGTTQSPGSASYLIVRYIIKNEGKEADVVSTSDFKIADSKGRKFTPSSEATTQLVMKQGADFLIKELQPGISEEGVQAFQLPDDAFDGKLILVVPEKGFFSKGEVRVKLGL